MAMVMRANKAHDGIGGHISTFASAATLYEVAFNHFFRGKGDDYSGDQIYFQGHASPGIYARAFLEGRLDEQHLVNFRHELEPRRRAVELSASLADARLLGVPHGVDGPGADHGDLPGPLQQVPARSRHSQDTTGQHVWAFLGDGETDEPESLGAITLAGREKLDNLIFVINCNLQRLDGPVRGNGKIIQELEGIFRGAGWNVIKVIWGDSWDPLLAKDKHGLLVKRMGEVVDGEYQKYTVMPGEYIREHFFGKYPELQQMVRACRTKSSKKLRRGGHDPEKVYAAYKAAVECQGRPTVILAKTIKGYGLGEAGEGRNVTHQQKKLGEKELARVPQPLRHSDFRRRSRARRRSTARPKTARRCSTCRARREALGGFVPARSTKPMQQRDAADRRAIRNSSKAAAIAKSRPRWPSSAS